jgi:NADH-quinone oxidoreductase subunit K
MHSHVVVLFLSAFLFSLGAIGVLVRKNAIIIFMCIELMFNSANLALVAYSHFLRSIDGIMLVLFVFAIAAAEAGVGLALFVLLFRNKGTIDVDKLKILKW